MALGKIFARSEEKRSSTGKPFCDHGKGVGGGRIRTVRRGPARPWVRFNARKAQRRLENTGAPTGEKIRRSDRLRDCKLPTSRQAGVSS